MAKGVGIGHQDFGQLIQNNCFYIDKTEFIRQWWESKDMVTLITRPRRFGKTLTMSMLEYFFSVRYAGKGELLKVCPFGGKKLLKRELFFPERTNTGSCRGIILSSVFPLPILKRRTTVTPVKKYVS